MRLSELLTSKTKSAGLTVRQLSEAVGVSRAYIYEVLAGRKGQDNLMMLIKIAETVGIDMSELAEVLIAEYSEKIRGMLNESV